MVNSIPLGCSLLLPVHTVNCSQTLKVKSVADDKSSSVDKAVIGVVVGLLGAAMLVIGLMRFHSHGARLW